MHSRTCDMKYVYRDVERKEERIKSRSVVQPG